MFSIFSHLTFIFQVKCFGLDTKVQHSRILAIMPSCQWSGSCKEGRVWPATTANTDILYDSFADTMRWFVRWISLPGSTVHRWDGFLTVGGGECD